MTLDQCQCQPVQFPFVCERHLCIKSEVTHRLCQQGTGYWKRWEAGHGPGQREPRSLDELRAMLPDPAAREEFSCVHRGPVLRQEECGCGLRGKTIDVLQCALHGECTIHSSGKSLQKSDQSGRVPTCIACRDRSELKTATTTARKLILSCRLSPGDIMTLTAAIESLHTTYPGQYLTDVRTPCPAIWEHNPHIAPIADDDRSARRIEMEYPQIHRSNQEPVNFLSCYTEYLGEQIGKPLKLTTNRPHLYLSHEEKGWMTMLQEHHTHGRHVPFWLINSGVKGDYTAKQWPVEHYQSVIDATFGRIQWVQIGEAGHNHPSLNNCINLVGKTDHRMLHRLAYHADGSLGPVTYLMHLMAAFEKPYIYIAGGREPSTWLSYPHMHTLHTIGQLDCCRHGGCWKSRIVPLGDGDRKDHELCEQPIVGLQRPVGRCMALIRPEEVVSLLGRICRA